MKYKVVMHLNELHKWNMAISNIKNFTKELENEEYSLIVVVNSEAIKGYLGEEITNEVEKLHSDKVIFKACKNSMLGYKISESKIKDYIEIVSTSVVEITYRQNFEGYAYIKL